MNAVALTGADQVVSNARAFYGGFSVRETSGAASALVRIYDNPSTSSGAVLDEIALAAGESAREWYGGGFVAVSGIYVDIVSGAVAGSVRVG